MKVEILATLNECGRGSVCVTGLKPVLLQSTTTLLEIKQLLKMNEGFIEIFRNAKCLLDVDLHCVNTLTLLSSLRQLNKVLSLYFSYYQNQL